MKTEEYFQSYKDYFWQWEENVEVIAIPEQSTIAYREFVIDIFDKLAPQGIPPFGALLLAIIATNPNANKDLDAVHHIIGKSLKTTDDTVLATAMAFLKILVKVPDQYKTGKNRLLLFQTIFEQCHNKISVKQSRQIIDSYHTNKHGQGKYLVKSDFNIANYKRDFRTIGLLINRFGDEDEIVNHIASLPELKEDLLLAGKDNNEENLNKDFVQELTENSNTFYVGSLIKRIWSGLNIALHSSSSSLQPLGGIADLTNKGDLDRILLSEFANDELIFMSRLANNEALYIQREVPPNSSDLKRIILIDVSLRNWGTPKTIAFAIMLAIAKHPKTDIECIAYVIGDYYQPVLIKDINSIIAGLQLLEGSLHAANGLAAFFNEVNPGKHTEVFLITAASTFRQAAMVKTMGAFHSRINYCIQTSADGQIDIYRRQQNGKKHIQKLLLPLKELWTKKIMDSGSSKLKLNQPGISFYPILFGNLSNPKFTLSTENGEVFQITKERMVLKVYDKSSEPHKKGWEMIYENLPVVNGEFEIALSSQGNYILFMFNQQVKEITLLNLDTGDQKSFPFTQWKFNGPNTFAYHQEKFHHANKQESWTIDFDGKMELMESSSSQIIEDRIKKRNSIVKKYSSATLSVLKNINQIFINEVDNLVFNIHELRVNHGGHIKLNKTQFLSKSISTVRKTDDEFVFNDGSRIQVNRSGMLLLISSNTDLPLIYIPSVVDSTLGVATEHEFTGNSYFYSEVLFKIRLKDPGKNKITINNLLCTHTGLGLRMAKALVDDCPKTIDKKFTKAKAEEIKTILNDNGADAEILPFRNGGGDLNESKMVDASLFFKKHVTAFINHIQAFK